MERFVALLKRSLSAWSADRAMMMGAALAFYTVFSVAPLLVISFAAVGFVFGEGGGERLYEAVETLIGPQGAGAIISMVEGTARQRKVASAAGLAALFIGASAVFLQLQDALNQVWKAPPRRRGMGALVKQRLFSFALVAGFAFVMMASLLVSAAVAAAGKFLSESMPFGEPLWQAGNLASSLAVNTALFAALFKVLPDVALTWRDVRLGALFTAVLFELGRMALGQYLGKGATSSAYGAAGSIVAVLLWVYYASLILLFGAEFTRQTVAAAPPPKPPEPGPGLARRLLRRVPLRVKTAAALGAVKGGGREAARELGEALESRLNGGAMRGEERWVVALGVALAAGAAACFMRRPRRRIAGALHARLERSGVSGREVISAAAAGAASAGGRKLLG